MAVTEGILPMPDPALANSAAQIPDKLYFRIGEVSRLVGVKPYVVRYWESEFPMLRPKKSGANHRLYRRKDVELLLEIKMLLYEKRYTIEGARNFLESRPKEPPRPPANSGQPSLFDPVSPPPLDEIRRELQEILALLG